MNHLDGTSAEERSRERFLWVTNFLTKTSPNMKLYFYVCLLSADRKWGQQKRAMANTVKKSSKVSTLFDIFCAGQRTSNTVKKCQNCFWQFSRGTSFPAPFRGLWFGESEKSRKGPAQSTAGSPCKKARKIHRRASAGAQGESCGICRAQRIFSRRFLRNNLKSPRHNRRG